VLFANDRGLYYVMHSDEGALHLKAKSANILKAYDDDDNDADDAGCHSTIAKAI